MKKHLYSMLAAATISGAIGANAQAEEIVVKQGDTLWALSQKYDVTVDELRKWNGLSTDVLLPNDRLEVSPNKQYIVQSGDSLWDIAKAYGVSVQELKTWNKLKSDIIKPGLKLTIYTNSVNKAQTTASTAQPAKAKTVKTSQATAKTAVKQAAAKAPAKTAVKSVSTKASAPKTEKAITVTATAYTASCTGCSGITKTGVNLKANPDAKVISVDPKVIPLGSKVYVEGYGYATAADTGSAIKGNIIDVFIPSKERALQWGRKQVKVTILN